MADGTSYSQTLSASAFLSGIGVDTHVAYTDGEYSHVPLILSDLNYLGVDQVRDGISNGENGSAPLSSYITLAQAGIHFTFIIEGPDNGALEAQLGLINQVETAAPGSITAIEGPNEINNEPVTFDGATGLQAALDMQKAIVADVKADGALAGVPVDYFTGYNTIGYAAGPDPVASGLADFDNQHPYPPADQAPAYSVSRAVALGNTTNPNEPAVYTETGYSSLATTPAVQERYELDLIMDVAQQDISKTYLYQLMDAYAPGSPQGDDGSGLFDYTEAPKPVATAIHNLTALLSDPKAAPGFAATPLAYTVSGLPSTGNSLAIEKSDGSYTVVVWAEPQLWDESTNSQVTPPTESVTVTLPSAYGEVRVYDPTLGTSAVATYTDQSSITVAVTDHPILIQVSDAISATGTSTSPMAPAPPTILNGVAEDGLLSGSTVFADASGSGIYASGDASAMTNAQGQFSLTNPVGGLVLEGGVDAATGLSFIGALEAPTGSSVITPLTTLISALLPTEPTPADVSQAQSLVLSAFNLSLSEGQSLTTLDPIAGVLAGDAGAGAVFSAGVEVVDTAEILAAALADQSGRSATAAFSAVISGLADAVKAAAGQTLDLTSPATVSALVRSAAMVLGIPSPSSDASNALSTLVTAGNSYLLNGEASLSGAAALHFASAVEDVEQGSLAGALSAGSTPASLVSSYTGQSLANAVQAAEGKIACYLAGTLIRTPDGDRPVEALKVGDLVMTRDAGPQPIKWMGRRSYRRATSREHLQNAPICFKKGSLDEGIPSRDLYLSPNHALFIDGSLVPASTLVNGTSIVEVSDLPEINYHHVELDRHSVLFANDAEAESFIDDCSRGVFHNIEDYLERYPDEACAAPGVYCAIRLESGPLVQAISNRLEARGARLDDAGCAPLIRLEGRLDRAVTDRIEGWAMDAEEPGRRVGLVASLDGVEVARFVAEAYRADLHEAGIGDGAHAFSHPLDLGEFSDGAHRLEVRFADTWALLAEPVDLVLKTAGVLGPLDGVIDIGSACVLSGWAQDLEHPSRPVGLIITLDDQPPIRVLANQYRHDLHRAGRGNGRHGFEVLWPHSLASDRDHVVHVRREADACELAGSPVLLPAAAAPLRPGDVFLTDLLNRLRAHKGGELGLEAQAGGPVGETVEPAERDARRLLAEALRRRSRQPSAIHDSHQARLKALIIDERWPDRTRDAGSLAVVSHAEALRTLGYDVLFLAAAELERGDLAAAFAKTEGFNAACLPQYRCVEDVLRQNAGCFDLIYLHRKSSAQLYLQIARAHCPEARILYSVADLHHVRLERQAAVQERPELLALARAAERAELEAALHADITLTHSPVEADALRSKGLGLKPCVSPFAAIARPASTPWAARSGLAFIGGADHAPNTDALGWLIRDILPSVRAIEPDLICRVVGQGWRSEAFSAEEARGLEFVGRAPDLGALLAGVRLTLAPLRFGAGVKGKVVESLAAGVPCILSELAAEGLQLSRPLMELIAGSPREYIDLVLELSSDGAAWRRYSRAGQAWAQRFHSQEAVTSSLQAILKVNQPRRALVGSH